MRDTSLFDQARDYAFDYLDGVDDRPVFPSDDDLARLDAFDEPMPGEPGDPEAMLRLLHEMGSPATVAGTGGRYFGFVVGGAVPAALAARWLADVWDQNPGLYVISPVVARLEAICERWLVDLLGLPRETVAGLVSGTSTATLCGLAAGRNELLARMGWDAAARGLSGAPRLRVVVGDQAHATVFKALSLLGLGAENVERVPVDDQGRINMARMPDLDARTLLVTQAGNVNTGAFDPLDELGDRARRAKAWLHVDGAFGLWAAVSRDRSFLTRGLEKADSWSVDGHKTLNAPYDCGIVLCRDRRALASAMQASASYIQYSDERDGMLYTTDMSRRARAVELWATLKVLGRGGVEELVDGLCRMARRFGRLLGEQGFRVLNDVVFNQVLVACDTPGETTTTLANIQASGECWCGGASWDGEPVIRISVCSWATTEADVDRSVAAFVAAREAARRMTP